MSRIIAKSQLELEQVNNLLDKKVPTYRQAYSDRTSWLMACLSELAYLKFNPFFPDQELKGYFIDNISKLIKEDKKTSLLKLVDAVGYDHEKEKQQLISELQTLKIELVDTFDTGGTQAILVSTVQFVIIAFRGTESTSIKDIKSDAKATTTQCETGGMIHSGFKEAFDNVGLDIQEKINSDEFKEKPLFITGHSLGGALATIAAKKLTHKAGIAACYTFGSPRVGDEEWVSSIKTPIYRVVNAADCVTVMPPGADTIMAFSWFIQFIPRVGENIRKYLLSKFGGYYHSGDMRYMTNCVDGRYDDVKLLFSVTFFRRIKGVILKNLALNKALADHSISIYRKKLSIIATKNNKK